MYKKFILSQFTSQNIDKYNLFKKKNLNKNLSTEQNQISLEEFEATKVHKHIKSHIIARKLL